MYKYKGIFWWTPVLAVRDHVFHYWNANEVPPVCSLCCFGATPQGQFFFVFRPFESTTTSLEEHRTKLFGTAQKPVLCYILTPFVVNILKCNFRERIIPFDSCRRLGFDWKFICQCCVGSRVGGWGWKIFFTRRTWEDSIAHRGRHHFFKDGTNGLRFARPFVVGPRAATTRTVGTWGHRPHRPAGYKPSGIEQQRRERKWSEQSSPEENI